MEIRFLGAHNAESQQTRLASLLIDEVLAVDAGGLTPALSLAEQQKVKAVLLTHHHFDHSRDLVTLAWNACSWGTVKVYALAQTREMVHSCLLDGKIYARFDELPSKEQPSLQWQDIAPCRIMNVLDYEVLALPVNHPVPAVGYWIASKSGASLFYTGDTGPGLAACWQYVSPQLLIIEVSGPDRLEAKMRGGHLTPGLLKVELKEFRKVKGYLPRVVLVHLPPQFEDEIAAEVSQVARDLSARIELAYEGLRISI